MNNLFDAILEDRGLMAKYSAKPTHMAMFLALRDYVKQGHELADLPWFTFSKAAKNRRHSRLKKAA